MDWKSFLLGFALAGLLGLIVFSLNGATPVATDSPANEADNAENDQPSTLFTNLYRGSGERNDYNQSPDEQLTFVINDQASFNDVWQDMFSGSLTTPIPSVNFDQQSVVIIMSERQPSADYQLTSATLYSQTPFKPLSPLKHPGRVARPVANKPGRYTWWQLPRLISILLRQLSLRPEAPPASCP